TFRHYGECAMIVTRKKDVETVKKHASKARKVIIVGCSECAAICRTGGSEQVREMAEAFSDREVLATISIESPCDKRISTRDFKRIEEELADADALIALTCGSGAQAISEVTGKRVVAALDTDFVGMVERLGRFYERCSHCGECILNETALLCPVTLCPKGVRNGPCDGIKGTACEVYEDRECVWHAIHSRLTERGELEAFTVYHAPVDWSECHSPKEAVWERS
ncbi:MAG TPA: methylenetetrahydrofolate reductase C-terminal domain-containing protein, partial [Spirochaetota bacterium]|nr:methylenetetrahydrofolate reductase C-terminal domain-containing protein [Spirochaetota bacterium]